MTLNYVEMFTTGLYTRLAVELAISESVKVVLNGSMTDPNFATQALVSDIAKARGRGIVGVRVDRMENESLSRLKDSARYVCEYFAEFADLVKAHDNPVPGVYRRALAFERAWLGDRY